MDVNFDLLGDPIPTAFRGRGRPPHEATDEKRRIVIQLLAFDWSLEKIAAALSITPPTLRKNYFRELRVKAEARARVEAVLLGSLMDAAKAGNAAAVDKYLKRLDRHDLDAIRAREAATGDRARREKKLGKKEKALEDAHHAHEGNSWSSLLQ